MVDLHGCMMEIMRVADQLHGRSCGGQLDFLLAAWWDSQWPPTGCMVGVLMKESGCTFGVVLVLTGRMVEVALVSVCWEVWCDRAAGEALRKMLGDQRANIKYGVPIDNQMSSSSNRLLSGRPVSGRPPSGSRAMSGRFGSSSSGMSTHGGQLFASGPRYKSGLSW